MTLVKGFTLVELLVVIAVIALFTVSTTIYFFSSFDDKNGGFEIIKIQKKLEQLDVNIKNNISSDYTVDITLGKGFSYDINSFSSPKIVFANKEYDTTSFSLKTTSIKPVLWSLQTEKDENNFSSTSLSSNEIFNFTGDSQETIFESTLDGKKVNTLAIYFYSQNNLETNDAKFLQLISLNTKRDKTGENLAYLTVSNKNGNKIISSGGKNYEEVFLFFEQGDIHWILPLNITAGK